MVAFFARASKKVVPRQKRAKNVRCQHESTIKEESVKSRPAKPRSNSNK
jgi:hypothetical protein